MVVVVGDRPVADRFICVVLTEPVPVRRCGSGERQLSPSGSSERPAGGPEGSDPVAAAHTQGVLEKQQMPAVIEVEDVIVEMINCKSLEHSGCRFATSRSTGTIGRSRSRRNWSFAAAPHCRTPILSYSQRITPSDHFLNWHRTRTATTSRGCVPRKGRRVSRRDRPRRRDVGLQPFDFSRSLRESFPFPTTTGSCAHCSRSSSRYSTPRGPRYCVVERGPKPTIDMLVDLNRTLQQAIPMSFVSIPGSRLERPRARIRSCRDTTWLLVNMPPSRPCRRFVPATDPAGSGREALDGHVGAERDFTDLHAWCEVYLRAQAGSASTRRRACSRAKAHSPLVQARADDSAQYRAVSSCARSISLTRVRRRIVESPRVTKPYTTSSGGGSSGADRRSTDTGRRRRTSDDGRRADLHLDNRSRRRGVEHRRARATKRKRAVDMLRRLKAALGTNGLRAFRPGQVVHPAAAAAGALGCYGAPTAARYGRTSALCDEAHPDGYGGRRQRFSVASPRNGCDRRRGASGYETSGTPLARAEAAMNVDPFDARLDDELDAIACAALHPRLDPWSVTSCRSGDGGTAGR